MWNRTDSDPARLDDRRRLPGVVDTIGIGYETLFTRPLLIVPPVLLDLYLWLGVHITSEPLMLRIGRWLRNRDVGAEGVATGVEERSIGNISELAVLWTPALRVPSFLSTLSGDMSYRLESWRPAVSLPWWGIIIVGLVMLAAGLIIGAEYLLALAAATARQDNGARRPGEGTLQGSWWLLSWYVVVAGIALLVTWPALLGYGLATFVGGGASIWIVMLLFLPLSWAFIFFFFSVQAMFVDRTGPLPALRSSYRVVRGDSWRSLGIIAAYFLVLVGFPPVWRVFISEPIGVVVAIVGHAFIVTGMIAATMVFYRDRVQQLGIAA